ncbi:MAG: right-handed parallel beta-helix repeat-containing protein [Candidatus Bathyarchaeota archaeon]|nr:MAG: right-handed parallel beta-helix repeat-containing protein [Candidatus Bathyarchaeota archaeon]
MMKRIVVLTFVSLLLLMMTIVFQSDVSAWSNGGYSEDPTNPDYGTHDWIAEHALDWLPEEEKQYIVDNLAVYLYGTELPDNGGAPDGIGDTTKHHIYYWSNGSLQDDASAVRAYEEYNNTLSLLELEDFRNASKTAGIMSHYIVDVAVFGHVMGAPTDWGAEVHHSDYETYVNQRTSSYDAEFNMYLSFDGALESISAYDAAKQLAHDTTFDVDVGICCTCMDRNYNWDDSMFKNRCGESLNLAVNYLADVLHTLYLDMPRVHNVDTGLDYVAIQEAIDAPETLDGHTIIVDSWTYYENVVVNKSISLVGEDKDTTVIEGNRTGLLGNDVIHITSDNNSISGFTVQNSGPLPGSGIHIDGSAGNNISNNIITNDNWGIWLDNSVNNTISSNHISNNVYGIRLDWSDYNVVVGNTASGNVIGMRMFRSNANTILDNKFSTNIWYGLHCMSSDSNTITANNASSNDCGIYLLNSDNNTLTDDYASDNDVGILLHISRNNSVYDSVCSNNRDGIMLWDCPDRNALINNNVSDNGVGIYLTNSTDNMIFHNNFINNTEQVSNIDSQNIWDDSYPSGGNYWSDYTGVDLYRGSGQNETGSDGIGDYPHMITPLDTPAELMQFDYYPLMGMLSDFNATSEHNIQTICNSAISDFQFNGTAIRFNITGEDGGVGFCRICIPTALMNAPYRVFVNSTEVSHTLLPCSNNTHSYLYFAYNHSTQEAIIIPEFPLFLILPLFIISTLLAAILCRRKHSM